MSIERKKAVMSRTRRLVSASLVAWVFSLTLALAFWLQSPAEAQDSGPAGDIAFNQGDLDFILKQIQIAERHSAGEELIDILPNASLPWGLRTVDGEFNNLLPGKTHFGQSNLEFASDTERQYPDAQTLTIPLVAGDVVGEPTSYLQGDGTTVQDSTPRLISNLIVDQSTDNPAAVAACDPEEDCVNLGPGFTGADMLFIPNVAVDEGLSAPFNVFLTFFGQFFDHGLDLVNKGGNGVVLMPLQGDDPLFGLNPTNAMTMTRATLDAGPDGIIGTVDDVSKPINATTPHVDQQQTYASHASTQVLLRHYEERDGRLQNTGRLLNGTNGGMSTWADTRQQALDLMGFDLDDQDGNNNPEIDADYYGNFIPCEDPQTAGEVGRPQLVTAGGPVCGDVDAPVDATQANRVGQSFFIDVAHTAAPNGTPDPDNTLNARIDTLSGQPTRGIREASAPGFYDDELLDAHFMCGDGRCNENIALTTIHSIFHREHNRLASVTKRVLLDTGDLSRLNQWLDTPVTQADLDTWGGLSFSVSDASLTHQADAEAAIDALAFDWNGQRIFQAARFGTEMQYNRAVFDEFVPTLAGLKDGFEGFHTDVDPTINSEFSQSVYRFGHSMLVNTVDRFDADWNTITDTYSGDNSQLGLFEAFLNPLALFNAGEDGVPTLNAEVATGAVIRGLTRAKANEIDEFVTGAMQNNLVGLPLDIGAINIARGRDVGNPPLNVARKMFFARTFDLRLIPYVHWVDYLDNLRHQASFVNFLAAYGTHPSLAGANGIAGDNDAGEPGSFADRRAAACAIASVLATAGASDPATYCSDNGFGAATTPADAEDFLYSRNAWANVGNDESITGLDDVDFWNGGLAEERMPFGGFLGSTHNYVFEKQAESLQNGDRFYYLGRTNGLHFFSELESNSFTALAMRNTDMGEPGAGSIPLNIFAKNNHYLEVDQTQQASTELASGMMGEMFVGTADPGPEEDLVALVIRDAADVTTNIVVADTSLFLQYTGGDHVVIGGTEGDDTMVGGIGDDSIWGRAGNDRIEGGDGADHIEGGPGDDIITDLSGPDVIEGGSGNDVISSGNEEDVVFGDAGKDFIVNSSEFGEVFGGEGDDFAIDGIHISKFVMGAGDDWLEELGGGENIHCLDGCKIPEAGEPPTFGNDVAVGYGGNNDWDMENGDDIMVDGPGIDRMEGQLGFDWASFQNDPSGTGVDLDLTIFIRPIIPPSNDSVSNRYDRVEGLSGSAFGDILRGTANSLGSSSGNQLVQTASRDSFALIEGLNDSMGNPGLVPLGERRELSPDPVTGEAQFGWTGGEIIIGGGSSDVLVGEAGDDILDGDSALDVGLEVAAVPDDGFNGLYSGMQALFEPVFAGGVNPGDIYISRVISNKDPGCVDTDTALYSGNRADYTIAAAGLSFLRVTDDRLLPLNVKSIQGGNDGADLVRNIERLTFADQTVILAQGLSGSCGDINNLATGSPEILGTPELDETLTADVGTVMDADGFDPTAFAWTWERETDAGSGLYHPIIRIRGINGNGDPISPQGDEFLVTAEEVGQNIRVVGIFKDDLDVFEIVHSAPVAIVTPPGFVGPPENNPAAMFDGTCAQLAAITAGFSNGSGVNQPRLAFWVGDEVTPVPLALFSNTEVEFPAGFNAEAEAEVSNIVLRFVNNGTNAVTGSFIPQIVAINDPMTGETDPNNVAIEWSIQGLDTVPLVDGPTTVSFTVDPGCGVFTTMTLDGNSSINSAIGVTLVLINGAQPKVGEAAGAPVEITRAQWDTGSDRLRVRGSVSPAGSTATLYRSSFFFGDVVSDGITCTGGVTIGAIPTDPIDGEFRFDSGGGGLTFNPFPVCIESDNGSSLESGLLP